MAEQSSSEELQWFWGIFGQIGVILFLLIGGFLYHRESGDSKAFWDKKWTRLILPWLVCSAATYILAVMRGKDLNLESYLCWVLGSGSWYYYIVMYLVLLFGFKWLYHSEFLLVCCVLVNAVSLLLTNMNKLPSIPYITPYLNVCNWIGFFAVGVLGRKMLPYLRINSRAITAGAILVGALSLIGMRLTNVSSYFYPISAVFEISAALVLYVAAYKISILKINVMLANVGKDTYFIYLVHMQIVQFLGNILPEHIASDFIRPVIGLLVMIWSTLMIKYVGSRIGWFRKMFPIIGLR